MGEKRTVKTKTPLRIGFGGTDKPEYVSEHGGAMVSGAFNRYIYVDIARNFYPEDTRVAYSKTEDRIKRIDDIVHPVVREAMKLLNVGSGLQIMSTTEIPSKGTGLGSSSSFAVGLLNNLHVFKGEKVTPMQLASEAVHIEREVLSEPGGKQDQYVAAFGGLQYLEFHKDGSVRLTPVKVNAAGLDEIETHVMLFFTGIERKSGEIHSEQSKQVASNIEKYDSMKRLASEMRNAMEHNDMDGIGNALNEGWSIKRTLSSGITTPAIDKMVEKALGAGAMSARITGAGGGGFLFVFAKPEKHANIRRALQGIRDISLDGASSRQFRFALNGSSIVYSEDW